MNTEVTKSEFSSLPHWVQAKIKEFIPFSDYNYEAWIKEKIPALGNQSVLDVIKLPEGESQLRQYFNRAIGK